MKRSLIIAFTALAAVPAFAADLPMKAPPIAPVARPIYDWTGLYLGLNGGGGRSGNCMDLNGALVFGFSPAVSEGCDGGTGAVAGGQIGYRYQMNSWVFGIEAQGDWADMSGSSASTAFAGLKLPAGVTLGLTNTSKVDAIGMFTGQVGYSFGPLLWYVKGGAAVTDNKYTGALNLSIAGPAIAAAPLFSLSATDSASAVRFGEVIGTGLEYMFAPGWSIGAEYNHLFMGSQNVGSSLTSFGTTPAIPAGVLPKNLLAPGMPTRNDSISGDIDMATVRLNYTFTSH
jgi:outer membrane immunogenic protein